MIQRIGLAAAAAALFVALATANAGGYRYGISDQAFYLPAIEKSLNPSLFPRDTPVLAAQMRLWLGDDAAAVLARGHQIDLPDVAGTLYIAGLVMLAGAIAYFMRGLGASWPAITAALAVATLRHHIAKTGANTLEGYFHPRMLAYAIGIFALGCVLRKRYAAAFALIAAALVLHTTAALWFGSVIVGAVAWNAGRRWLWVIAALIVAVAIGLAGWGPRMDAVWLAAVSGKDYLFPSAWPLHAWLLNFSYPIVLVLLYRRRVATGREVSGERALVAGLLILVIGFLVSVPLSAAKIALAVQLQITRVFWVLDVAALLYLTTWLIDDWAATRRGQWRRIAVAVLCVASFARGYYILYIESGRPLVAWRLPNDEWIDTMNWLKGQPLDTNVLVDPSHGWRYGSSVRLAAERDTVLEEIKDSALAMYDHDVALRVRDRVEALSGFADFTTQQVREAGARYQADVVVIERPKRLELPVVHENARFTVYDLRR